MCEKCVDIDRTIERFLRVQRSISDELTVDRAKEVILELETIKAELHSSGVASPCLK
jgi:hypothetical protein